jgi:hypothetical protein
MDAKDFKKKFPVGSKVTSKLWLESHHVTILFLGEREFFCRLQDGCEISYPYHDGWLPYEEPQEEKLVPINFNQRLDLNGGIRSDFSASYGLKPMKIALKNFVLKTEDDGSQTAIGEMFLVVGEK